LTLLGQQGASRRSHEEAYERVRSCLDLRHSLRQHLQLFYLLGRAFVGMGELTHALTTAEVALDLADQLPDLAARAELGSLAGWLARTLGAYVRGAEYSSAAAALLIELGEEDDPADTGLMIDVLTTQATCASLLEAHRVAWAAINAARALVARPPGDPLRAARLDGVAGLLHRAVDDPAQGLREALPTSRILAAQELSLAQQVTLERRLIFIADCALDVVENPFSSGTGLARDTCLQIAATALRQAAPLAQATGDALGNGIALLARVRAERLQGRPTDRLTSISSVLQRAEKEEDPVLTIHAFTARGKELLDREDRAAALPSFQVAADLAARHQAPALGRSARRELARAGE
jgi:hypothetical protein